MRESAPPSWTPTAWCLTPPLPSCLQTMAIWASMSPYPCAEWSFAVLPPSQQVALGPVTLTFQWPDCFWPFKMEVRGVREVLYRGNWPQGIIGPPPVLAGLFKSCIIFTPLMAVCLLQPPKFILQVSQLIFSPNFSNCPRFADSWCETFFNLISEHMACHWNLYNWDCDRL